MYTRNSLLLLSGQDLPFVGATINIHQPRIKEIAFVGEDLFFLGTNFLCFSKDKLNQKDKINLTNKTDFDILMSMINNKTDNTIKGSIMSAQLIISLIFPDYQLMKMPTMLVLTKKNEDGTKEQSVINNSNYDQFRQILRDMFCLKNLSGGGDYNPANKLAQQIANKLRDRHKKLSKNKPSNESIDIIGNYVSVLSLGAGHTINQLMQYTLYQLFDQFNRFIRKYKYESWYSAKLAGAEGLDDVNDWIGKEEQETIARPSSNKIEYK